MQSKYEEYFFNSIDGLRLFMRQWPVPQSKGVLAVVHGFAEHSGRYGGLVDVINRAGWSVAAFDCRGHGQSGGRRAHIDRFDEYLKDVSSFLAEIKHWSQQQPLILLGHSQGGLIAARYAELYQDDLSAVVLSSPFLGLAVQIPIFKVWGGKLFSECWPSLSMKSGVDPAMLSHDRSVVEQYVADPLVSDVATARWFTEVGKAQELTIENARQLRLPLLLLQAGSDQLVSIDSVRQFYSRVASTDKTYNEYEGFYHEVFNEIDRKKVFDDLNKWLEAHQR